ncbi:MAG: glycoside hydrolase family 3 N-terminal domain-containing protein [Longimicrobiales bacterium]|nr:glycoside hydrolase family 3 N-terminal domain-containing protein [Longimicrobiales bacterium]
MPLRPRRAALLLLLALLGPTACGGAPGSATPQPAGGEAAPGAGADPAAPGADAPRRGPGGIPFESPHEEVFMEPGPGGVGGVGTIPGEWSRETLAGLTLRQKIGQMIMPIVLGDFAPEGTPGHDRIAALVEDAEVGGVIVSVGSPTDVAVKLNDLQRHARLPLLVGSDLETGPGFRLSGAVHSPTNIVLGGATQFPNLMALGAADDAGLAYEMGRITALEARAVGIHLPFAPVLDVNNNPDNPIINVRSFGEDPEAVARLGTAFVRGVQEHGAIATGKHFPGHGDTGVDSHLELPRIEADRARMDTVELVPFRAAVAAGMGAIMTAHISVPALSGGRSEPATLSAAVMDTLLRREMGFDGLLVTDAMDMGAIERGWGRGEASVRAVEAGADILLMPPNPEVAIDAVLDAVVEGRIPEARIDRSVRRILEAKERLGLHRDRFVRLDSIPRDVGVPAHTEIAERVARTSLTLLRNERDLLPLLGTRNARVISVTYRRRADLLAGRYLNAALRARYPRLETVDVGADSEPAVYERLLGEARRAALVVISLHVTALSYTGTVAIPEETSAFIEALARAGIPHVVVSFGNPYLIREFPSAQSYLLAYSGSPVSQRAVGAALFGEIPVTGRLPTRIPPLFEIGEGIMLAARPPANGAGGARGAGGGTASDRNGGNGDAAPGTVPPLVLEEVDPGSVGMSPDSLGRLDALLDSALAAGAAPGAALAVGRGGRLVRLRGYGTLDWDGDDAVTPATRYDLASLTKVVGTTSAVMILLDRGRLSLEDPVVRHLPWWSGGDARKARVTLRHLLTHTAGLAPFRRWYQEIEGRDAYRAALAAEPLEAEPGGATVYSDLGVITLGLVVEAVAGVLLDRFLERELFRPLGMGDTGFTPAAAERPRIAPTEVDVLGQGGALLHGVVHDENARAMGGVAGHAGLFSSARDLAVFAQFMLDRGASPAGPLIRAETVARFTRRQDAASSRALGWDTPAPRSSAGDYLTGAAFGHTGFTGTSIWIDPELDLFVVLLTNRVNPTRENTRHVPLRRAVHELAARAITDRAVPPRPEAPAAAGGR